MRHTVLRFSYHHNSADRSLFQVVRALQSRGQKLSTWLVRLIGLAAVVTPIAITKISTAGFSSRDLKLHVEIDGVNFGSFDRVEGLTTNSPSGPRSGEPDGFRRVTFRRDFVTDPSLYLWAKNISRGRSDLKDVHVVVENPAGEAVSRYVLKMCQPLSWSVEAANPALGGFHETIDMAVQEIAFY